MNTFLAPIEKPRGFGLKLAYHFSKKIFGKVLTPLKVHSARLPVAFGMFYGKVSRLDKKLELSPELALMIRVHVARINVCLFCMDAARFAAVHSSMNVAKFDSLDEYTTSHVFSDAERAALHYVTVLTQHKQVDQVVFERLTHFYSERQICEIVWLVASEHLYNLTNIGLNIHSDLLCEIKSKN
jgi:alkylhydroperoxidase family enzyme